MTRIFFNVATHIIPIILFVSLCTMASAIPDTTNNLAPASILDTITLSVVPTQTDMLNERLSFATEIINAQDSLMNGFSTIYTVITIIISLLTIGLPILTYLLGIRPSQKAKKKMEAKVEEMKNTLESEVNHRIGSYLTDSWNRRVDETLQYIKENANDKIDETGRDIDMINLLISSNDRGFSESQLSKIYMLLTDYNNPLNPTTENVLARLLFQSGENDYSKRYFKNLLEATDKPYVMGSGVIKYAVLFCSNTLKQYAPIYNFIYSSLPEEEFDEKSSGKRNLSLFIQDQCDIVIDWANDKNSIDKLSPHQAMYFFNCFERVTNAKVILEKLMSSYLFEKCNLSNESK